MTTNNAESLCTGAYAATQSFVINLCSSTSPMALAHPTSPELKRYTFFVSRERQDGRDRFRLHMGYFASQEEAERMLEAVRDVYPAAWAGPAPAQGIARRGRVAMKQPVQASVPQQASAAAAAPVKPAPVKSAPVVAADPVTAISSEATTLARTMSEMRSVLAKLDDEAPTVKAPRAEPVARPAPVRPAPPVPAPVANPPRLQPVRQARSASSRPAPEGRELTPQQALALLETTQPLTPTGADPDGEPQVKLLTPEDTQTIQDITRDKANNAPPSFAVQLVWSVKPIDAASMPHLAIFDAYTLYNVEGNRQGRKWYGLRLGFFTEPAAATQVANYVRGDYRSVAVVPVSTREMDHAGGGRQASPADSAINPPLKPSEQFSTNSETMSGFELVLDDRPAPVKRDLDMPQEVPTVQVAVRAPAQAPAKTPAKAPAKTPPKTGKPAGKRAVSRPKPDRTIQAAPGAAAVLESTLEILGASTLTIDDSKGLVIDEAATRRPSSAKKRPQNSKFSKLLSRLGGG